MSADGDFQRLCQEMVKELKECVEDIDRFEEIPGLFVRAALQVAIADGHRDAWLWGHRPCSDSYYVNNVIEIIRSTCFNSPNECEDPNHYHFDNSDNLHQKGTNNP